MTDKEKDEILNEHELSPEEMKPLGGGVVIDWPAKCQATVENGSSCTLADACYGLNIQYYRDKAKHGCSATVAGRSTCWSNDNCYTNEIYYDTCKKDYAV